MIKNILCKLSTTTATGKTLAKTSIDKLKSQKKSFNSSFSYAFAVASTLGGILYLTRPPDGFYEYQGKSGFYHSLTLFLPYSPSVRYLNSGDYQKHALLSKTFQPEQGLEQALEQPPLQPREQPPEQQPEQPPEQQQQDEDGDIDVGKLVSEDIYNDSDTPTHRTNNVIKAQFVLVGGGTSSYSAMKAIQEKIPNADILIISAEEYPPYMRPPLSKELWFTASPDDDSLKFKDWGGTERSYPSLFYFTPTHHHTHHLRMIFQDVSTYHIETGDSSSMLSDTSNPGHVKPARLLLGHRVVSMDPEAQTLTLHNQCIVKYSKVLLATGGTPNTLGLIDTSSSSSSSSHNNNSLHQKVSTFRDVKDFKKVRAVVKEGKDVVIIGGGFLGSELACAIAKYGEKYGTKVTQVFPEDGNMGHVFPTYLSKWTTSKIISEGVNVLSRTHVTSVSETSDRKKLILTFSDKSSLETDHVVIAAGISTSPDYLHSSGLEIDDIRGGIMVNSELEARTNVWVAGDLTSFHDTVLGRRRIEHHDHAVLSGRWAGRNMVSSFPKAYKHLSMFWSDLGPEIGYEAVGILDSNLKTVSVWERASVEDSPAFAVLESGDIRTSKPQDLKESSEKEEHEVLIKSMDEKKEDKNKGKDKKKQGEEYGKGIVFYLRDEKIVGVLLWNMFHRTPIAQRVIREGKKANDVQELARIFHLYEE